MLKTILKVNSKTENKPKPVKVTEGDLSRIGAEKFRKVEFVKNPVAKQFKVLQESMSLNKDFNLT